MDFNQVDYAQIRNVLPPSLAVRLGNQVQHVDALRTLPVLLLVPVEILDFQLQLLKHFSFLLGETNSTELLLFQLDFQLLLSPQPLGTATNP